MSINPLLQARGQALDPAALFEGNGNTRISVINFCGLVSDQARQAFVNQLQMALFTWVNPKAWVSALGALAAYTSVGGDVLWETLLIAGVLAAWCLVSATTNAT